MLSTLKKINFLITKRQRKGLVILTLLLFVGMFLEVFGLGILIPVLSILLDPKMVEKTPLISSIRDVFSEFSDQSFIIFLLVAIIVVYLIKSLFLVLLTHKQNVLLNNISTYVSNNLFHSYLIQPYSFHLNKNAAELIKNIQVEINYFYAFLLSLITVFLESGFVISILAFLIYLEPLGAISIGLFYGMLSFLFLQFTKRRLSIWGKQRQELDSEVSKIALEGFGGIKDLLILGKTSFFIERYSKKNLFKARIGANHATLSQIPRFYLELSSIFGLISFIVLLLFQGKDAKSLITILGIFVAATFRMIPSLNRIISAFQTMKFYKSSVDVVHNESENINKSHRIQHSKGNFKFQNKIVFKNINFSFFESNKILKDLNFEIQKGNIIGIIGESGSGKSTLVDLLLGLHLPNSGDILIDGISGFQMKQSWRSAIGYVSQSIYLIDDSIKNNIALGISEDQIEDIRITEVIKQVQLYKFINNLELGVNTRVGERGVQLSGGQRQRIGIARALYNNPDLLILDEATSALDTETEKEVMDSIHAFKGEKTIILIAHRLSTLSIADHVYKVVNNKIIKV